MSTKQLAGHKRKISFAELTDTFRRAGPMIAPPPHQNQPPQLTAADVQRQQLERTRQADLARRQSKKPTDREIPDELGEVIIGDGVEKYRHLRDVERKLDAVMMRKRLDVSDNLQRRYTRGEGVLRVWVSNTAEGQPWQVIEEGGLDLGEDGTFDFAESQATFRVKMEGRLLEDPEEKEIGGDGDGDGEKKAKRPRLSNFFKAITIDFDRNPALQDGNSQIEWRKPPPNPNADQNSSETAFDTLEFERKADENINVTINMYRDEKSERFKLSPQLAEILDAEEEDRAGAVQGIWEYCRAMGLQEDEDRRRIVCDEPLRKLFNRENIDFPYVPELLSPHLHPLPPLKLNYTIRVDKDYINAGSQPTIYDLRVSLPNTLPSTLQDFQRSKTHIPDLKTIIATDDDLALLVQKLHNTNAKRKFFENLAKDPANFLKRWTSSQQRDLEVILAEQTRGGGEDAAGEEFRRGGRGGVWGSENARESVGLWLAKGQKAH